MALDHNCRRLAILARLDGSGLLLVYVYPGSADVDLLVDLPRHPNLGTARAAGSME